MASISHPQRDTAAPPPAGPAAAGKAPALPFWPHDSPPQLMLVSDLDHTMVQNEDATHRRLLAFNAVWQCCAGGGAGAPGGAPGGLLLVYSTGRSPALYHQLWEEAPLLTPHVLICSVGTEIFYLQPSELGPGTQGAQAQAQGTQAQSGPKEDQAGGVPPAVPAPGPPLRYAPDPEWEALLDRGWDRGRVEALAAAVASEQRRHKLSYHLDLPRGAGGEAEAVLGKLKDSLKAEGLQVKVVYSGGRDVDLLARGAGKGAALAFLLGRMREAGGEPRGGVQVNGDSGNDVELFAVPGVRGCVVANAYPELRDWAAGAGAEQAQASAGAASGPPPASHILLASEPCAGGILQALRAFRSLPPGVVPDLKRLGAAADGSQPGDGSGGGSSGGGGANGKASTAAVEAATGAPTLDPAAEAVAAAYAMMALSAAASPDAAAAAAAALAASTPSAPAAALRGWAVAAAASAAAAAGVWLDRVEVTEVTHREGGGEEAAERIVSAHVFRLGPEGRRDLGAMRRAVVAVAAGAGAGGSGGHGPSDSGRAAAAVRYEAALADGAVVLPPVTFRMSAEDMRAKYFSAALPVMLRQPQQLQLALPPSAASASRAAPRAGAQAQHLGPRPTVVLAEPRPAAGVDPTELARAKEAKVSFGKHKGALVSALPVGYLNWMCRKLDLAEHAAVFRALLALGRITAPTGCIPQAGARAAGAGAGAGVGAEAAGPVAKVRRFQ
ncbi:hypothetical protein HYH03_005627 [Edaphochlamys debaryana]|uniref:Sucrose phosphatase-like domain-containing protein n=1 Tax=Edaphochlamys debaryana TaxID=47281 RepID=A0A835YCM1_9CHLO|nr:hypothetical protein HYH03_005627 [Edaphochlamys debaryana]|eukprot:KAG2496400.1 hypothetical protein HYH03_005627 [Edaphochlamys debaryana]